MSTASLKVRPSPSRCPPRALPPRRLSHRDPPSFLPPPHRPRPRHRRAQKPQSAYFHFVSGVRARVKEANPGLGLGAQQKIISAEWRELRHEQKQPFIDSADKDKARYAEQLKVAAAESAALGEAEGPEADAARAARDEAASNETIFPLARIKKVMKLDPDVKNMSAEAVKLMAKAAELFVGHLGSLTAAVAEGQHRRTVKEEDLGACIHHYEHLEWLMMDFDKQPWLAAKAPKKAKAQQRTQAADAAITSFFGAGQGGEEEQPSQAQQPTDADAAAEGTAAEEEEEDVEEEEEEEEDVEEEEEEGTEGDEGAEEAAGTDGAAAATAEVDGEGAGEGDEDADGAVPMDEN